MTATNHVLGGALIGALLPLPLIIPVAFLSHFALDALPHYGIPHKIRNRSTIYKIIVFSDTAIATILIILLILTHKWKFLIGSVFAYAPDITWVIFYFLHGRNLNFKLKRRFMQFHRNIQRFERPWGIIVELVFASVLLPIYASLI